MKIEPLQSYWQGLSERDRSMLSVGGVVVLIYLFYLLIYSPLISAVEMKSKQWVERKETLQWMQTQLKVPKTQPSKDVNLLPVLSTQLKQTSFTRFPYQLQQTGAHTLQLSFENVPYIEFMSWLQKLGKEYTVTIVDLTVTRTKTPGLVKLQLVFENKGK